jgi:hypothetical protein
MAAVPGSDKRLDETGRICALPGAFIQQNDVVFNVEVAGRLARAMTRMKFPHKMKE